MKRVMTRLSLLLATLAFFSAPVNKAHSNNCSSTFSHAVDSSDRAMRVRDKIDEMQQDYDALSDEYSDDASTDDKIAFIGKVCSYVDEFIKLTASFRERTRTAMEDFGVASGACTGVNQDRAHDNADLLLELSIAAQRNLETWKKKKRGVCSEYDF